MKPLLWNKQVTILMSALTLFLLFIAGVIVVFKTIFLYLFISVLIVMYLNSGANLLQKIGVSRLHALSFVVVTTCTALLALSLVFTSSLSESVGGFSTLIPTVEGDILQEVSTMVGYDLEKIVDVEALSSYKNRAIAFITTTVRSTTTALISALIIVPVLSIILLKDWRYIKHEMYKKIPNRFFEVGMATSSEIESAIKNFILAKSVQTIMIMVFSAIGLAIVGAPSPLILGITIGLFNIVPYLGPILGAILPLLLGFLSGNVIGVIIVLGLTQALDNFFIQPKILPKLVNEHPLSVVLVTLAGATLFGIPGMIFALPVFTIVKIIYTRYYQGLQILYFCED